MPLTLYWKEPSSPCRTVVITATTLGLNLEFKDVNLLEGENKKEEFTKINPQQTIPVLDDNGFILCDSHVISAYLIEKYAKNDSLYPKNYLKRLIVDQRLHFDSGTLWPRCVLIFRPLIYEGKKGVDEKLKDNIHIAYDVLEKFLAKSKWIAGDNLTIADYSLFTSVVAINILVPVDAKRCPKLQAWVKKVEILPECKSTENSLRAFEELLKACS